MKNTDIQIIETAYGFQLQCGDLFFSCWVNDEPRWIKSQWHATYLETRKRAEGLAKDLQELAA